MRSRFKPSLASRASVRSLIVACMPTAAVAFVANAPALGAILGQAANQDLAVEDNSSASTNGAPAHVPSTNNSGNSTNRDWPHEYPTDGIRG